MKIMITMRIEKMRIISKYKQILITTSEFSISVRYKKRKKKRGGDCVF